MFFIFIVLLLIDRCVPPYASVFFYAKKQSDVYLTSKSILFVIFPKVLLPKVIFPKVIFPKVIFLKVIFPIVLLLKNPEGV